MALCLLACLPVLAGQAAAAQDGAAAHAAQELWRSYPLTRRPAPGLVGTAVAAPVARAASSRPAQPATRSSSEGGAPDALLVVLVILAVLVAVGVTTVPVRREQRQTEWAPGTLVPSAPSLTALRPAAPSPGASDVESNGNGTAEAPRRHPALPRDPQRAWTAEIEWRHSGGEPRFCAVAHADGRAPFVVAESPRLEWPPVGAKSVQALADAAHALEAALAAAGWRALPSDGAWYAKRFGWEPVADRSAPAAEGDAPPRRWDASGRFLRFPSWPERNGKH